MTKVLHASTRNKWNSNYCGNSNLIKQKCQSTILTFFSFLFKFLFSKSAIFKPCIKSLSTKFIQNYFKIKPNLTWKMWTETAHKYLPKSRYNTWFIVFYLHYKGFTFVWCPGSMAGGAWPCLQCGWSKPTALHTTNCSGACSVSAQQL